MPQDRVTHWNPPGNSIKTACGNLLSHCKWTTAKEDVTCNNCLRSIHSHVGSV